MKVVGEVFILLCQLLKCLVESIIRWFVPARYKSVEGEVCLITGSASGIGRLMALEFARRKSSLVLWDVDEEGNEETAKMARELGATVFAEVCDVSQQEQVKAAAERARKRVGEVTILVNNAGVTYCKKILDLSDEQIKRTFGVNTFSHIWTLREFLPHMMETNHGHLVTVASTVGLFASPGMPDYISSKHAAVGLHNSVQFDLKYAGKNGVKTTLVCPYLISTGMFTGVSIDKTAICPPIRPEECVERIMHAVLTERHIVAIPRLMYLMHVLSTCLSFDALWHCYVFMGADKAISKFRPNRSYQHEESVST